MLAGLSGESESSFGDEGTEESWSMRFAMPYCECGRRNLSLEVPSGSPGVAVVEKGDRAVKVSK